MYEGDPIEEAHGTTGQLLREAGTQGTGRWRDVGSEAGGRAGEVGAQAGGRAGKPLIGICM